MSGPRDPPCPSLALAATLLVAFGFPERPATAQTPDDQSSYVFQTNSRVVLTDITVTDTNGDPVHGLPQSAFRIFDNEEPQVVASFEEHTRNRAATIQPASTAGVYSNDYLLHLPAVLNIVLIDIVNIEMAEQMYLNYELTGF